MSKYIITVEVTEAPGDTPDDISSAIRTAFERLVDNGVDLESAIESFTVAAASIDIEDDRGNLWEAPDDEGRIRVRDLDGDLVTWYDPGDDGYDDALARFEGRP